MPDELKRIIKPLPVNPDGTTNLASIIPAKPVLDATLGQDDLRIKLSCEVLGRNVVYSNESLDEKLPGALMPEHRGALAASLEQCIKKLITVVATRINLAMNEPVLKSDKPVKQARLAVKAPVVPNDPKQLTELTTPSAPLPTPPQTVKPFPDVLPPPPPPPELGPSKK